MNHPDSQAAGASTAQRYIVLILLALAAFGGIGLFVTPIAIRVHREARRNAVYSYLASVQRTVTEFRDEHGHYPKSLIEIDTSALDYDVGIPLDELGYRITDAGVVVSYRMSDGNVVSYPDE